MVDSLLASNWFWRALLVVGIAALTALDVKVRHGDLLVSFIGNTLCVAGGAWLGSRRGSRVDDEDDPDEVAIEAAEAGQEGAG